MSMLPPVFVELRANIGEFKTKMGEAKTEIAVLEKEGSSKFSKVAAAGKAALMGLTVVAVGVGIASVKMADEFEQSHSKLETALKNAGASYETYKEQIAKVSKQQEMFGYNNAQTEEALANLTTALGSPKKALADMGLAADVAKFKHIDLAQAATLVAKASEGNLKPLKAMGIDLPIASAGALKLKQAHDKLSDAQSKYKALLEASQDPANRGKISQEKLAAAADKVKAAQDKVNESAHAGTDIMKALADKVGGTAANASKTLGGQVGALKAQTEDLFKNIGMKLIPILQKMVHWIVQSIKWFGEHKTAAMIFGTFVGVVLVGLIGAYISSLIKAGYAQLKTFAQDIAKGVIWVATKLAQYAMVAAAAVVSAGTTAVAWIAANAAMIIASAGLILVIGLVVAAGLWLKNHWEEFMEKIKGAFSAVSDWVKKHSKIIMIALIAITGPVGILVAAGLYLKNHWREVMAKIKDAIHSAAMFIQDKVKFIHDVFSAVFNALSGIVRGAFDGVASIIKGYLNIWIGMIDFIIQKLNSVISKANTLNVNIPGIGKVGVDIPTIPEIPKLAMGGIVNRPTMALIGEAGPEAVIPLSKMNGMGGMVVHVHVSGSVIQERDLAVSVRDNIAQLMRRRGLNPSILGV